LSASKEAAVRLIFGGRVQGVNFRDFTRRQAEEHHLVGCVRNLEDGTVQVIAEGQRPDILHFIEQLMSGPPHAVVNSVDTQWVKPSGDFTDFSIRY
jgi:acylphosphatase